VDEACAHDGDKYTKLFFLEILKEKRYLEDIGTDGRILKWILCKYDFEVWIELVWLSIGTGGRLF
jgi:hypothetical protein